MATGDLSALGTESLIGYVMRNSRGFGYSILQSRLEGLDGAIFGPRAVSTRKAYRLMMVYADDLRYINHPDDTVEHLDAEPMGQAVAVVLGIIESF